MEPREVYRAQRGAELLKAQVAPVATLGELVATVTAPRKSSWPLLYPKTLHEDLKKFIWFLRDTLDHGGVTSLCQAMATLRATPLDTKARDCVTEEVRKWRKNLEDLEDRWHGLSRKATKLHDTLEEEAMASDMAEVTIKDTNKDTAEATATSLAGDLQDETRPSSGTAGDNLVATAQQPSVALPSAVAAHDAPMAVATKRGERVEEALELLERLGAVCWEALMLPLELQRQLWFIKAIQGGTEEASPDVPERLVAAAAEFEWLCEASARLTRDHLLVPLGEIDFLLSSRHGGSGGPCGPRGRAVAEWCRKAIEAIPRLLGDSDVTAVTSSGQ